MQRNGDCSVMNRTTIPRCIFAHHRSSRLSFQIEMIESFSRRSESLQSHVPRVKTLRHPSRSPQPYHQTTANLSPFRFKRPPLQPLVAQCLTKHLRTYFHVPAPTLCTLTTLWKRRNSYDFFRCACGMAGTTFFFNWRGGCRVGLWLGWVGVAY
jgi:hypothetical protein